MFLLDRESPPAAGAGAVDTEALIEEARRRMRRRRWRRALAGVAVAAIAVVVSIGLTGSAGGLVAVAAGGPYVDAQAFSGNGELAFVSHGALWVLDGETGSLQKVHVPRGLVAAAPTFSRDGRWLAYEVDVPNADYANPEALWIARGDGSRARRVAGHLAEMVGWSPVADRLAFVTNSSPAFLSGPQPTRLELVTPAGGPRLIVAVSTARRQPNSIEDVVWASDGRSLAVATHDPFPHGYTTVRAYPIAGGRPTTWFSIQTDRVFRVPGICTGCGGRQTIADPAGWWPHWGIAFWIFSSGMDHNSDGTALAIVSRPGATPYVLTDTLSDRVTDALATGPGGALAIVASTTGGREIGSGKTVEQCDARTHTCRSLPGASTWSGRDPQACPFRSCSMFPAPGRQGSAVTLDPAWSPNGSLLAYVKAPVAFTGGSPMNVWYAAHEFMLWNARTGATTRLAAVGTAVPTWSRDGRSLLYVAGNALWLVSAGGGRPTEIADPLLPADWRTGGFEYDYYGQVPWGSQFSWWSP